MDEERDVDVPEYFLCPISLQVMKDPVTTVTGITYERVCIQHWLSKSRDGAALCPVTKQPLPRDSDLTPNHTLRRLIQAWSSDSSPMKWRVCVAVTTTSPNEVTDRERIIGVIQELKRDGPRAVALKKLGDFARGCEENRICMVEAGAGDFLLKFIARSFQRKRIADLEEGLRILHLIWIPNDRIKLLVRDNHELIDALTWILCRDDESIDDYVKVKGHSILTMNRVFEVASMSFLERLKPEAIICVLKVLRDKRLISHQGIIKSALQILTITWPLGRNRARMSEEGIVFDLVELELRKPEKRITELVFNLLASLCSYADGREQLLRHAGGIAMLAKRMLRVSPAVDDRAVQVLAMIAKFSGSKEVVSEMLRVGAVSKLCMVLQANCEDGLKRKAKSVLKLHSNVWNNSPCIDVYLLTVHPAR